MNNREIEAMRQETTGLALLHVNQTPELYKEFIQVRDKRQSLKANSLECEKIATLWSENNKDEFGALFIAELPLVRWNTLLKEL